MKQKHTLTFEEFLNENSKQTLNEAVKLKSYADYIKVIDTFVLVNKLKEKDIDINVTEEEFKKNPKDGVYFELNTYGAALSKAVKKYEKACQKSQSYFSIDGLQICINPDGSVQILSTNAEDEFYSNEENVDTQDLENKTFLSSLASWFDDEADRIIEDDDDDDDDDY